MKRQESGYVLVTVAVLLIVLLAFTALAIDIGMGYSARTQNQAAADAAALAGAYTFLNSTLTQPAAAQDQAVKAASANKTMGTAIAAGEVTAVGNAANRRVTVTITRTENTFFSKVIGFNSIQVRTSATAEAGGKGSSSSCTKPWFIPNNLGTLAPCGPGGACSTGQTILDANGDKTTYADTIMGNSFVMKPQSPGGAIAPSDFYGIIITGNGANDYRDAIGACVDDAVLSCQTQYNVKTGNMKGPTQQGVDILIGNPPTDHYVAVGQYRHADTNIYDTSRALVVAPIVDLCNYPGFCPSGLPSGGNVWLKVIGFARFFVEGADSNGNITGRFVGATGCGPGGGAANETGSESFGVPIRLVRLP